MPDPYLLRRIAQLELDLKVLRERDTLKWQRLPRGPLIPPAFRYGKVATAWVPGQTYVELTPVPAYNNSTATGEPNGHALVYGLMGAGVAPALLAVTVGDILPYLVIDPTGTPLWLCISPPVLPPGTAQYQVFQMIGAAAGGWDYPVFH